MEEKEKGKWVGKGGGKEKLLSHRWSIQENLVSFVFCES